jgi:uncharacterized protein (DUF2336 family)
MVTFDTSYLLELARQKSTDSRSELAATISDLFSGEGNVLSDRERALMYEIIHRIVKDAEMDVRKVISTRLADREDAPLDLIEILANDRIDVAYPILTESTVLRDQNLIDLVRTRTMEHQMAVSIRHSISEEVSEALVATNDERVIRSLLQNDNASISQATMEYLVEQSERVDSFQEPVLRRSELKPDMAKRMYMWVSAALRKYIVEQCDLDQAEIDDLIENVMVETVDGNIAASGDGSKSEQLANELKKEGRVSPELMIRALQDGEVRLFVELMAQSAGLRTDLVMRFMLEPGGEGLSVACRALNLSDYEFQRIYTLSQKSRRQSDGNGGADVAEVVKFYRQITKESAAQVIKRWQRDSSYLSALRDLNVI